ncbi:MAG: ATP-binding cassette domain-containing protein [Ruminococcaceae bacterium]|nr:ATP-binding cassette domain-containing protein [Oscillospiraceae bacterium]
MIKIENLVKRYGQKYALDGISLEINHGDVVGFLGPNGAGKSTAMNIITGYLSASSGNVYINDISVLDDPILVKSMIGYLPEQPPLYIDMTVREYLNFVFDLKKCTYSRKKHIDEICSVVKITDVSNRVIRNLSKGYRQRVGIAQALIGNPPIIIMDEPTVGLDPKEIIEIRSLIRRLGERHTIILSSHILSEIQAICERIVIIDSGRIVADKPTDELARFVQANKKYNVKVAGPKSEVLALLMSLDGIKSALHTGEEDGGVYIYTVEAEAGVDVRKLIFSSLAENGWPMMGLEEQTVTLEDVFISIVDNNNYKKEKSKRASWDDDDNA